MENASAKAKLTAIDKGWASYTGWQREYFIYEAYNLVEDIKKVTKLFGVVDLGVKIEGDYRVELHYLRGKWLEDLAHGIATALLNKLAETDDDGNLVVTFPDKIIKAIKLLSELKVARATEKPVRRAGGGSMEEVQGSRDKLVKIGKEENVKAA